MAITRKVCRERVRELIGDLNIQAPVVPSRRMDVEIHDQMRRLAALAGYADEYVKNIVTLVEGDFDYTLPASVQYDRISHVFLDSQGWPLDEKPRDLLVYLTERPGAESSKGDPRLYAMWQDESQVVQLLVYPVPRQADFLHAMRSAIPATLATDASLIPFGEELTDALVKAVAVACVQSLTPEQRARLPSAGDVALWQQDKEVSVHNEAIRRGRMLRPRRFAFVRW